MLCTLPNGRLNHRSEYPLMELRESRNCADRRVTRDRAPRIRDIGTQLGSSQHADPSTRPRHFALRTPERLLHNKKSTEHAACHGRPEICRHTHHHGEHSYQISLLLVKWKGHELHLFGNSSLRCNPRRDSAETDVTEENSGNMRKCRRIAATNLLCHNHFHGEPVAAGMASEP
jgi:hypothetical protein